MKIKRPLKHIFYSTTVLSGNIWQELEPESEPQAKLWTKVEPESEPKIKYFDSATLSQKFLSFSIKKTYFKKHVLIFYKRNRIL